MYVVPEASIEVANLPPPIRTSDAGSFARYTFVERIPGILREALAQTDWPHANRKALDALHAEVTNGRVSELREDTADRAFWSAVSAAQVGRSWLDVPWYSRSVRHPLDGELPAADVGLHQFRNRRVG